MKLAFVPPRFGPGVLGGSEAVMAEAAAGLAGRGHQVEVLTTCALDHYTWENELPEGLSEEKGLAVRRFLVSRHFSRAGLRAQLSIQSGTLPDYDHQVSWLGFQFMVPGLFEHLARYGQRYDGVVFSPYMFWTTSACLPLVAGKAVLMPCLHDEPYARLDVLRPAFELPAAVWFLSEPEHELAHSLGPLAVNHSVTGAGLAVPGAYDPDGFRRRYGLSRPFLVYAGRREEGKGTNWLLHAFSEAVLHGGADVDLVLMGKGDIGLELAGLAPELQARAHDIGYVSDEARNDGFAAALAYVHPSNMESFSRTAMEAWLASVPVLARSTSRVVTWHCGRSGGGLSFADGAELAAHIAALSGAPARARELGQAGRRYVLEQYAWDQVLDRMEASLAEAL